MKKHTVTILYGDDTATTSDLQVQSVSETTHPAARTSARMSAKVPTTLLEHTPVRQNTPVSPATDNTKVPSHRPQSAHTMQSWYRKTSCEVTDTPQHTARHTKAKTLAPLIDSLKARNKAARSTEDANTSRTRSKVQSIVAGLLKSQQQDDDTQ